MLAAVTPSIQAGAAPTRSQRRSSDDPVPALRHHERAQQQVLRFMWYGAPSTSCARKRPRLGAAACSGRAAGWSAAGTSGIRTASGLGRATTDYQSWRLRRPAVSAARRVCSAGCRAWLGSAPGWSGFRTRRSAHARRLAGGTESVRRNDGPRPAARCRRNAACTPRRDAAWPTGNAARHDAAGSPRRNAHGTARCDAAPGTLEQSRSFRSNRTSGHR